MGYLIHQTIFVIRHRFFRDMRSAFRKTWYRLLGMRIGKGTLLRPIHVTWPHQVSIGNNCVLEHDIHFKYDGIWKKGPSIILGKDVFVGTGCEFNVRLAVKVGDHSLIASGCRFIDHDHGTDRDGLMGPQLGKEGEIILGKDVWLGCNVVVLKDVEIGEGAIVAAGSVVTKSIGPYEIWAGIPAKKISERKSGETLKQTILKPTFS